MEDGGDRENSNRIDLKGGMSNKKMKGKVRKWEEKGVG
jgi:hypothetical protein